ncbi:MAG: SDR family oxidoreductase [Gammaproteobacteria bacterium]|nr:SDR family oxidoreductase [Gammaproteobacteria bacterium]
MRNVLVTGGSRGLGLAMCRTLSAAGYRVIALARTQGKALEELIGAAPGPGAVHFQTFDLTDTHAIAQLVSALRRQFGALYGLVNNAGIGTAGVHALLRDEQIETLVRLNTVAPLILSKYVVRAMMADKEGRIVNIASIIASTGYQGLAAYAATKAALVGFTRSLAREVGPLGITVNAVAPGFVPTEMTRELEGAREQIERRSALKCLVEPEDVAAAVQFLLSDAARHITGITLTVDAGSTA